MKAMSKSHKLDVLKALQEGRINLKEAKELMKVGIPLEFWYKEGELPIRRQAYREIYGDLPSIEWVDTDETKK